MTEIKFSLSVHTPWRPLEGLLIDIKTRFASNDPGKFIKFLLLMQSLSASLKVDSFMLIFLDAVEALRQHIDKFLTDVNFTNACLVRA